QRESMIETLSLDDFNPHHYKDTDGFLELSDGLKIGYFETTWRGHDSAELKNTIQFWLLVEKDIKVEDLRKELDKSDINGEKLSPNFSMYNQEATVYKDSVMIGSVDVPTK